MNFSGENGMKPPTDLVRSALQVFVASLPFPPNILRSEPFRETVRLDSMQNNGSCVKRFIVSVSELSIPHSDWALVPGGWEEGRKWKENYGCRQEGGVFWEEGCVLNGGLGHQLRCCSFCSLPQSWLCERKCQRIQKNQSFCAFKSLDTLIILDFNSIWGCHEGS